MVIKGVGSSSSNAAYPDLILDVDEKDDQLQAKISSLWNACYAFGWALGPLLGGVLYDFMDFEGYASFIAILSGVCAIILFQQARFTNMGYNVKKQQALLRADNYCARTIASVSSNYSIKSHRSKR